MCMHVAITKINSEEGVYSWSGRGEGGEEELWYSYMKVSKINLNKKHLMICNIHLSKILEKWTMY